MEEVVIRNIEDALPGDEWSNGRITLKIKRIEHHPYRQNGWKWSVVEFENGVVHHFSNMHVRWWIITRRVG